MDEWGWADDFDSGFGTELWDDFDFNLDFGPSELDLSDLNLDFGNNFDLRFSPMADNPFGDYGKFDFSLGQGDLQADRMFNAPRFDGSEEWTNPATQVYPSMHSGGPTSPSAPWWERLGTGAARAGEKILDRATDDPFRALGLGAGGLAMLYGMMKDSPDINPVTSDERNSFIANMSPEEKRLLAVQEEAMRRQQQAEQDAMFQYFRNDVLNAQKMKDDPRLLREQREEMSDLQADAIRRGGSGALTSTWFQNQSNDMRQRHSENLFTNRQMRTNQNTQNALATLGGLSQSRGAPAATAGASLGALSNIANPMIASRSASNQFNAAKELEDRNALLKGGGFLFGSSTRGF